MKSRLVLAFALWPLLWACTPKAPAPEPIRSVKLVTPQAERLDAEVGWAAEVRARYEARLSFRIGGLLTQRQVELGQRFKAGQVLAELDPQDAGLSNQSAQAQLLSARVQRDLAAAELQRFEALFKQGFIGQAEWDRRQAALQSAQAQLNQAQAQADLWLNQSRYTQLLAPQSGVVTGLEAEPGQVLAAGAPVLRVAWDGPREVQAWVSEDQVSQWRSGQSVQVARWGHDQRVPARVRDVAASADPQTRSYLVRIDLPSGVDWALGQTARVWRATAPTDAQANDKAQAHTSVRFTLPTSAIQKVQGQPSVWVYDAQQQTVAAVAVQVLHYQGDRVVLGAGLGADQQVVASGGHTLSPGQKVVPYVGKNPVPEASDTLPQGRGRP